MVRTFGLIVLLSAPALSEVTAQQMTPRFHEESVASAASRNSDLLSEPAQAELAQVSAMSRAGEHALYTLGFTLVGSGLGYFASQVAYSDWDKIDNSTFANERRAFSLTGAAVGAVAGFILGSHARTGRVGNHIVVRQELAGTDFIPAEEVEGASGVTAYEVIQVLRPNWLIVRGTQGFAESGTGTTNGRDVAIVPGLPTIKVYTDNAFLGGLDALKTIPKGSIVSMQRLTAAQATTRWGAGHTHGAIVIQSTRNP